VLSRVSLACRLVLAGVLGYAAITKIGDPAATVRAVRAYQILPESLVTPFGHALPWVELAVAALLVVGLAVRVAGAVGAVLMAMFVGGIASAWARGLRIDCGCFGGGGATAHPHYLGELLRDLLLLAVAVAVAVIPTTRLAVDPQPPAPVPDVDPSAGREAERRHRAALNRRAAEVSDVSRRRRLLTGVGAAVIAVMAVTGIGVGHTPAVARQLVTPASATVQGGIVVGSASAKHHLIAYEDPQCPVCGEFEKTSGPTLAAAVAAGQVSVEYRMMSFLGPESVRAVAALAAAADQGRFAELRDAMFAHQPKERTGGYTTAQLVALGRTVGLTDPAFVTAVNRQTYKGWAGEVEDLASKAHVVGTPTLLLDGKALSNQVMFTPAALAEALR
jgi:protein-disulfide isomerase